MSTLALALKETGDVELGFVCYGTASQLCYKVDGPLGPEWTIPIGRIEQRHEPPTDRACSELLRILEEFQPDLVHVHGTEQNWGLFSTGGVYDLPTVISIQGLLHVYYRHDLGGLSDMEALKLYSIRDWVRNDGMIKRQRKRHRASLTEMGIIQDAKFFIGRTKWDRAHVYALNANAVYFHCDEIMRPEFFSIQRDVITVRPFSIFSSAQPEPLKGLHVLLKAAGILCRDFPELRLYLAGRPFRRGFWITGFERHLCKIIEDHNLDSRLCHLGPLNAHTLSEELGRAAVFVLPSFIENSSNALAEAMLAGVPIAASFVGGNPSMVQDGDSALCFPQGDEAVLAECIRELFLNEKLALRIAQRAREVAFIRHNPTTIAMQTIDIYTAVCKQWSAMRETNSQE
jgi:glycosyltransferase involved in cell wall biosynthesis